jgi:hypothetical protein
MDRFVCLKKSEIVIPEEAESSSEDSDDDESDEDSGDDDESDIEEYPDDEVGIVSVKSSRGMAAAREEGDGNTETLEAPVYPTSKAAANQVNKVCRPSIVFNQYLFPGFSQPSCGHCGYLSYSACGRCSEYAIARRDTCSLLCSNS